jgi:hypothetical protein
MAKEKRRGDELLLRLHERTDADACSRCDAGGHTGVAGPRATARRLEFGFAQVDIERTVGITEASLSHWELHMHASTREDWLAGSEQCLLVAACS